jgi:putative RNA 2'-phosphotransferase
MTEAERVQLSKLMSYLLRHRPDQAGLTLDEDGLAPLDALLAAIRQRPGYAWVTVEDVQEVVATCEKQRFRLEGDHIGARYGHSRRVRAVAPGEPVEPPELLYHGAPRRAVPSILATGLQPRARQFVHLSATPDAARHVGRRRDERPALLIIQAQAAHADGLVFYAPTPDTYLVHHVPPDYITLAPEA